MRWLYDSYERIGELDRRLQLGGVPKKPPGSSHRINVFKRNKENKFIVSPAIESNKIKLAQSETLDLISKIKNVKISEIRNSKVHEYIEWIILINQEAKKQKAEADKNKKK